jgi:hypothetical protein
VSSYLYHRRCNEGWCINTDMSVASPITYPRVDYSFQHRPERWKREYLKRLGGRSYQQNLLDRDQADGLAFELAGYTATTLAAMRAWWVQGVVLQVQLEEIAAAFDDSMLAIFKHLGFAEAALPAALECARLEDVARMDDAAIAASPHINGRELSKWRRVLTPEQVAGFERRYGDLIVALGYELAALGDAA